MNTNWPDVAVVFLVGLIICFGIAVGAWLAYADHPWFALIAFLVVGHLNIRTGGRHD